MAFPCLLCLTKEIETQTLSADCAIWVDAVMPTLEGILSAADENIFVRGGLE